MSKSSSSPDLKLSREERFKSLRKRANESLKANRSEVYEEHKRSKVDEKLQARLQRQREAAEFELAELESKETGEDFERKRVWDWTIEESEKWDQKKNKVEKSIESSVFSGKFAISRIVLVQILGS
ncbi:splicing factor, SYF2 family [Sugiyamaella lignohabitans]|uniref:Pre-mRNA-splicing factor SYF2 n=1 Tax=Sugiyamaella lignohabitans TaxID=796027 RepID=A0A161HIU9_9ASCO|nr:splicing factor, SYF2 family [Sugiyamaella lignohabitans]ANB11178.1 splicing factor, SYF2 family [Sugiyamaella lignohabitans]